jgi:small subunit ribosomal protein S6
VKSNITKNRGELIECDDLGSRDIQYEIVKNKRGY